MSGRLDNAESIEAGASSAPVGDDDGAAKSRKRRASYTWKGQGAEKKRFKGPPRDTAEEAAADGEVLHLKLARAQTLAEAQRTFLAIQKELKEAKPQEL